jgi:hypothetical protein
LRTASLLALIVGIAVLGLTASAGAGADASPRGAAAGGSHLRREAALVRAGEPAAAIGRDEPADDLDDDDERRSSRYAPAPVSGGPGKNLALTVLSRPGGFPPRPLSRAVAPPLRC